MSDADPITLHALGPEDHARLLAVPEGLFDNPIDAAEARAFLSQPQNHLILAYDGACAVGLCSGTVLRHPDKPPALFVNEVGVRESHQRRGIARRMLAAMLERARAAGCTGGIWLGTEADNAAAQALYRSLGAEELPGVFFGWDGAFEP